LARTNGVNAWGVSVSVKCSANLVLLSVLVNFIENTSVMSFCRSGVSRALPVVTLPLLIDTYCPALSTVISGSSVTGSNRMYEPVVPSGSTRTWNSAVGPRNGTTPGETLGLGGGALGSMSGMSKLILTSTAVPRMPMVATGVLTFMSPCLAVSPATKVMVPATRLSSDELLDPFGS
jgi:hypothetical protein